MSPSFGLRDISEAHVQGADQRRLVVHRIFAVGPPLAQERHQPLGKLPAEQKVNAGIRAAVQTGQQHQDGESGSWNERTSAKRHVVATIFLYYL